MKLLTQSFIAIIFAVGGYCISQEQIEFNKCYETICWNPEEYPAEKIMTKLYEENDNNIDTFGKFEELSETFRREAASCSLCKHRTSLRISPLTLKDGGNTYYIVRTQNYQHSITLNICESDKVQNAVSACLNTNESKEILDIQKACEQKFSNIKFLVYDEKNEKFIEKTLQYPSACVCTVRKN